MDGIFFNGLIEEDAFCLKKNRRGDVFGFVPICGRWEKFGSWEHYICADGGTQECVFCYWRTGRYAIQDIPMTWWDREGSLTVWIYKMSSELFGEYAVCNRSIKLFDDNIKRGRVHDSPFKISDGKEVISWIHEMRNTIARSFQGERSGSDR